MSITTIGADFEKSIQKERYFDQEYFSQKQLNSFSHQINYIYGMRPTTAIEIGIGNGFVSTFLKNAGYSIITADINPELKPDICAPLSEVKKYVSAEVDLVICCEVLEHMQFEEFDENLDRLKELGARLFLTLPNSHRTWGVTLAFSLPKIGYKLVDLNFRFPFKHKLENSSHFWEIGHTDICSQNNIVEKLKQRYKSVKTGRFPLNPYHTYFICDKRI